jgi:outer membrane protein assembly factor BamD (BamD/ComL family)
MMSSGISASGFPDYATQGNFQQIQQEFQQLGKDLQAGNLTAAESDFVTLQQDLPQSSVASASQTTTAPASSSQTSQASTQTSDPIAQAFAQLASDLQAGNLTAAQKDYSTLQQDFQSAATKGSEGAEGHFGHHHHHSESSDSKSTGSSPIGQLLNQLGQELKAGNLSATQQTYQSLQQDMKQFSQGSAEQTQSSSTSTSTSTSGSSSLSVSA